MPRPLRTGLVALGLGVVLGTGLALVLEYLDDSIKTKDQLDRLVPGVPVLGLIPAVPRWRERSEPLLVATTEPSSPAAEAYRSLRTALQFVGVERPPRVFQITSARSGDGKSSVAANLAVVLARGGSRVALVDCDLRRTRLHEFFDVPNAEGFTSVFVNEAELPSVLRSVPGLENLSLLTSGPLPPNPSELLSAKKTAGVFAALQADHDIVLIDCPPVLPVADAIALSTWVDATLLVVAAETTTERELRRTVEILRHAEADLVGTVLNRVTAEGDYRYAYRYPATEKKRRRRGKGKRSVPETLSASKPVERAKPSGADSGVDSGARPVGASEGEVEDEATPSGKT